MFVSGTSGEGRSRNPSAGSGPLTAGPRGRDRLRFTGSPVREGAAAGRTSPIFEGVGQPAAVFDLDRTLLKGASGPFINETLHEIGLRTARLPGESLLYRLNDLFGESPVGIALARGAGFAVSGWSVERMREAGERAAERLCNHVAAYARGLLEQHREAGDLLVLATTTPYDLVRPLADRLGLDEVIATRYASRDGAYTGRLEGPFVWGRGKLTMLRRLAEERGIDLESSFAYSDSIADLPLLAAVGRPRTVNPDLALHTVALARRWPVLHLDVPPGVATFAGLEPYDIGRHLLHPELFPYARFEIEGIELIPNGGPFIIASNHESFFDVVVLALCAARGRRRLRILGSGEAFDSPLLAHLSPALGGVPAEKEETAADVLAVAEAVLRAGDGVVILPQGHLPRPGHRDLVRAGARVVAELAAGTGAPVVPVGLSDTEAVWPRSSALPNLAGVLHPPRVTVRVGAPMADLPLVAPGGANATSRIRAAIAELVAEKTAPPGGEPAEEEPRSLALSGTAR